MKLNLIHISDALGLLMVPPVSTTLSPETVSSIAAFQDMVRSVYIDGYDAGVKATLARMK